MAGIIITGNECQTLKIGLMQMGIKLHDPVSIPDNIHLNSLLKPTKASKKISKNLFKPYSKLEQP